MRGRSCERLDEVVSALNNFLELHSDELAFELGVDSNEIVSRFGFGYTDECDRILHWIEGGDIETCSLSLDEIERMMQSGLTKESMLYIFERCS